MKKAHVLSLISAFLIILFFPFWIIQFTALFYIIVIIFSFLYSVFIYKGITVKYIDSKLRAFPLEKIKITLEIENRSLLFIHFFSVIDNAGSLYKMEPCNFLVSIPRYDKKKFSYTVQAQKRGLYKTGPVIIKGSDPLGIFRWVKKVNINCEIIIYPHVYPVNKIFKKGQPGGSIRVSSKIYEDPTRYRSLREYNYGDDIKSINWKASARLGSLHITEYLPAVITPVLVVLNLNENDYPDKRRFNYIEKGIQTAASLIVHFINLKQSVGLITQGRSKLIDTVISGGTGHAEVLLEILAGIKSLQESEKIISTVFRKGYPSGTHMIFIGPAFNSDMKSMFFELKKKGFFIHFYELCSKNTVTKDHVQLSFADDLTGRLFYE